MRQWLVISKVARRLKGKTKVGVIGPSEFACGANESTDGNLYELNDF